MVDGKLARGTVEAMTRGEPINDRLLNNLHPFSREPDFLEEIAEALGAESYEDLESKEDFPVLGYYLRTGEVFGFYAVTPGRFCFFERNRQHDTLTISLPIERVRRVVLARVGGVLRLSVELEADSAPISLEGRVLSEPRLVDGNVVPGGQYAEMALTGSVKATTYEWATQEGAPPSAEEDLREFGRALRNAIGF